MVTQLFVELTRLVVPQEVVRVSRTQQLAWMSNATGRSNEQHAFYDFALPHTTISGHNIGSEMMGLERGFQRYLSCPKLVIQTLVIGKISTTSLRLLLSLECCVTPKDESSLRFATHLIKAKSCYTTSSHQDRSDRTNITVYTQHYSSWRTQISSHPTYHLRILYSTYDIQNRSLNSYITAYARRKALDLRSDHACCSLLKDTPNPLSGHELSTVLIYQLAPDLIQSISSHYNTSNQLA
ncbi:hypothetical protein F511_20677 [Dorcoceras hygrometricum]|uniref:Uncharacterized protein n=1 Tax=Dorcoceras hygrometricum TaxID=472368 RepID=A0A2Z7BYK2_9LAMI|nr:hypothetical protein F511_20677 [Dorcoceras hygrometricum]